MGIFDTEANLFAKYRATLQIRNKLMGGIPKHPALIEAWLRTKAGVTDVEELRQMMLRTLIDLGADVREDMTYEEMVEASKHVASHKQSNGFKKNGHGLYIEARQIKAMLKESTNVLFAGDRWGETKKGPKSYLAERVFVNPDQILLERDDPDGVELVIGHVRGPKGEQSTLTYVEYATAPRLSFDVLVTREKDKIDAEQWAMIWMHAQENGLGALRSQGYGRFDIEAWDRLN